jgi:hypothetical protein
VQNVCPVNIQTNKAYHNAVIANLGIIEETKMIPV